MTDHTVLPKISKKKETSGFKKTAAQEQKKLPTSLNSDEESACEFKQVVTLDLEHWKDKLQLDKFVGVGQIYGFPPRPRNPPPTAFVTQKRRVQ